VSDPSRRLAAALAGRYSIEREVGEGGMATVYLATDLKHDRRVAIKVLKPELAAVVGADRFLREITTTANLQHPHFLPLFDSGAADGFVYYVMPYVEGETLRARLDREGQLAVDDALDIARVIAGALDFAHRRGVIHRDIKPENVLLQDGLPLVADFGIAVAVSSASGERLTETGLSLGTPSYMSPEQIAGEGRIDARSDEYALACLTYEMLAGDPPFVASSPMAVIARHLTDPAPPVTTVRRSVPPAAARAIARALSKAPSDRYESTGAFARALREEAVDDTEARPLVVVLPFVNRSQDAENEYFSDGLTEEVIADLSQVGALHVISRNSAMTLKGTTKDTPTLAKELGVSHVVTGSVRRAGVALRVMVELVEATTDRPVWSEKYSGTMEDVFGIQEEIARKIVSALELSLTDRESRQVAERPIENPVAYDCYLRARQEMYRWTPDAARRALRFVDDALEIVGDSPLLLAMKAQLFWNDVNTNQVTAEVGLTRAMEFVDLALALDPDIPLAVYVRGLVAGARGLPELALPDLYRAHDLWPGDANIIVETCRFSNTAGLRNLGSLVDRLTLIDPLTAITQLVVSSYHWVNGRHDEAADAARRASDRSTPDSFLHHVAAMQIAASGAREEASRILAANGAATADPPYAALVRFLQHALDGDVDGALRFATQEMEQAIQNEFSAMFAAEAYTLIGRPDDALRWLRFAIDRGFISYPFIVEHDPFLVNLRDDGRFRQLADDVRLRWESIVKWERDQRADGSN